MNQQKSQYDLTNGGILSKLLLVAVPIMGTQLMQMAYNLTDMFWLGRLGVGAVAASGTAGMFIWLSVAFLLIGRMGAEIGVSQSLGRSDSESAQKYAQNSILLALLLGCVFGLAMILFRYPLVGFFNIQEAEVAADTRLYLAIVSISTPFSFASGAITGTFNGSGNSRTPFVVNAAGLVLNIILDPILIFSLNLGIAGAGIATIIAQTVVFVSLLITIKSGKNRPFPSCRLIVKPDKASIRQILIWSVPIGLESMLFTLLSMIVSRFVASFGAQAMAASRVGSQIESLSWLVGGGFGSALTSFVGQNYGAGKWARIHKGFRISITVMLVYGLMVTALLFFCGNFLFSIFFDDPDILSIGVPYLQILAMCQLPMCLEAVSSGAFKGTGRTMEPSIVSFVSNSVRVPLAYVLSQTSLGLNGIWLGVCFGALLRGAWSLIWYVISSRKQPKTDVA